MVVEVELGLGKPCAIGLRLEIQVKGLLAFRNGVRERRLARLSRTKQHNSRIVRQKIGELLLGPSPNHPCNYGEKL